MPPPASCLVPSTIPAPPEEPFTPPSRGPRLPNGLYADELPEVDHLITEDDTPVDNIFSLLQMNLLADPLHASWKGGAKKIPFVALCNVGMFAINKNPAIVPDMLLALDVALADDIHKKENRSYMLWKFGKSPDVVVEIVSNNEGGEDDHKLRRYLSLHIPYYVIFDPDHHLSPRTLRTYEMRGERYADMGDSRLELYDHDLRLDLWHGKYNGIEDTWLRWHDFQGRVFPTGAELAQANATKAETSRIEAETAKSEAETAKMKAEEAEAKAERLAERLRALGIDPASL